MTQSKSYIEDKTRFVQSGGRPVLIFNAAGSAPAPASVLSPEDYQVASTHTLPSPDAHSLPVWGQGFSNVERWSTPRRYRARNP